MESKSSLHCLDSRGLNQAPRTLGKATTNLVVNPLFPTNPYELRTPYSDPKIARAAARLDSTRLHDPDTALYPARYERDQTLRERLLLHKMDETENCCGKCWRETSMADLLFFLKVGLVVLSLVAGVPVLMWYVLK